MRNIQEGNSLKIDFHNHFYPKEFLEEMRMLKSVLNFTVDTYGRVVVEHKGMRFLTITEPMYKPEVRIKDMDEAGVDIQVLSLSAPNVYFASPEDSVRLAKLANDIMAQVVEKYPGRFMAFASLPLLDVGASLDEAERAVKDLGMKGFIIGSNIGGKTLDDSSFMPFYEKASNLNVPIFIHPMPPLCSEAMGDYRLVPLIGFEFDISLAIARLVFSGVLEKYPNLKVIVSHLGGGIPFLYERIEFGFRAYPECKEKILKPPGLYLKKLYYDTVSFHEPALLCTYLTVGSGQMVLGSDYPHVIGDLKKSVISIEKLNISFEEKEKIFSENARKILSES
jgi:aminocarboxymuconate-semialdehyde decarboxylase